MLIPIDRIVEPESSNFRRSAVEASLDRGMEASIVALGQLQPILVRSLGGDSYCIVFGRRRLRAMRRIGHTEIEATIATVGSKIADAMQGAENMVRVPMDAVDQWAVVGSLVDQGYSIEAAGEALGLTLRTTQRLHRLAALAPPLVEAMRGNHLPTQRDLGIIAGAPPEHQIRALERHVYADHPADWSAIAGECVVTSIPRSRAIFDVDDGRVQFQEDLFAEPGSNEQFTTRDVGGFMAAQMEALQSRIMNSTEPATIGTYNRIGTLPDIPKGWTLFETSLRAGDRALPKNSKKRRVWAIVPAVEMHRAGQVISIVIEPSAAKPKSAPPSNVSANDGPAEVNVQLDRAIAETPETGITRAGQRLLAHYRTEGLREALINPVVDMPSLLALLVIALSAEDLQIGQRSGRSFLDLAAALLTPAGDLLLPDDDTLCDIAGVALSRMLTLRSAADQQDQRQRGSGRAAEWIGRAVQAENQVPPLDTEDFLACVSGPLLNDLAAKNGISDTRKAPELRKRLIGRMQGWMPFPFGAPGPRTEPWQPDAITAA